MFLCSTTFFEQAKPMMTQTPLVLEIVTFRVLEHISPLDSKKALKSLNEVIKMFPGFIDRMTAKNTDHQYIDIVYWKDLKSAQRASKQIMTHPDAAEIFKIMSRETVEMNHYEVFNHFEE